MPESRRIWRQQRIDRGVLEPNGSGGLVFRRDHLFKAPTGGAIALIGRNANGWTEWKNAEGLTLHQLQREPQAALEAHDELVCPIMSPSEKSG